MCELCSDNQSEVNMARKGNSMFASELRRLANEYDRLSQGRVKPHTDDWAKNRIMATNVIRNLVNDWV